MPRTPVRLAFTAALALSAACGSDKAAAPNTEVVDVYTPGSLFSPYTAEIGVGGSIRFHMSRAPDGDGHNAIFGNKAGAPDDVNIVADTVVTRVFNARGTFGYVCTVHPGMAGEVVVH